VKPGTTKKGSSACANLLEFEEKKIKKRGSWRKGAGAKKKKKTIAGVLGEKNDNPSPWVGAEVREIKRENIAGWAKAGPGCE